VTSAIERRLLTPAALALIAKLTVEYGPIMFHQSGGCCDGSSPMCYPVGDFLLGDQDVKLGEIGGAAFYIGAALQGLTTAALGAAALGD